MKRTTVYLPDEQYEGLRRFAFEQKVSITELIRQAIERVYREDWEDLRDMEEELAKYQASPDIAVNYAQYRKERLGSV
jgi:predicted transcriptional regulator